MREREKKDGQTERERQREKREDGHPDNNVRKLAYRNSNIMKKLGDIERCISVQDNARY